MEQCVRGDGNTSIEKSQLNPGVGWMELQGKCLR